MFLTFAFFLDNFNYTSEFGNYNFAVWFPLRTRTWSHLPWSPSLSPLGTEFPPAGSAFGSPPRADPGEKQRPAAAALPASGSRARAVRPWARGRAATRAQSSSSQAPPLRCCVANERCRSDSCQAVPLRGGSSPGPSGKPCVVAGTSTAPAPQPCGSWCRSELGWLHSASVPLRPRGAHGALLAWGEQQGLALVLHELGWRNWFLNGVWRKPRDSGQVSGFDGSRRPCP
ncbi:uncharacterized protein LOC142365355 [Opisthocomus hoazin]|uniref:uncharacterized protein LOC142365355 n=1 Tax=Opisthocomus hoazin TaxID=30419 RepID=UPI003F52E228